MAARAGINGRVVRARIPIFYSANVGASISRLFVFIIAVLVGFILDRIDDSVSTEIGHTVSIDISIISSTRPAIVASIPLLTCFAGNRVITDQTFLQTLTTIGFVDIGEVIISAKKARTDSIFISIFNTSIIANAFTIQKLLIYARALRWEHTGNAFKRKLVWGNTLST